MYKNTKAAYNGGFCVFGGDGEDRTLDLCVANAALSQLSYAPVCFTFVLYHLTVLKSIIFLISFKNHFFKITQFFLKKILTR